MICFVGLLTEFASCSGVCDITVCSVQLADKLLAVFLCPTLSKIDGKSTDQLKQTVRRCRNKWFTMV